MLWRSGRRSENINDRRGVSGSVVGGGGALLVVGIVVALLGGDPTPFLMEGLNRTIQVHTQNSKLPEKEQDDLVDFSSVVLAGTEDVWHKKFNAMGMNYSEPKMIIYSGIIDSACGTANAAVGPFYCPNDQTVYLDLEFFHELKTQFSAPGDFAQAYVIAHEVGHHVQNLLGVLGQAQKARARSSEKQSNAISVKTELMADCLSGIWAKETQSKGLLETGDIEEALNAASKIGDDAIQKKMRGTVIPDSFTHGSSAQRQQWFETGFTSGDINTCNPFI